MCIILCVVITFSTAYAAKVGNEDISSGGAYVMDFDSGKVLYSYNPNAKMTAASLTKLMTMYIVYEKIKDGQISYSSVVPITKNAYTASRDSNLVGHAYLNYGEKYTVDELINSIWVSSLNAAAIALAEYTYKTEANFVNVMNEKCAVLGIDAHFVSSHGVESTNKITPEGVAKLARRLILDFPEILNKTKMKSYKFHGTTLEATNKLLSTVYYEGADGLKTGTTNAAGYCFCGTAQKNGRRIIAVTMKSQSANGRFYDCTKLLNYGFDKVGYAFATDIKTFIDGSEVPTFIYDGEKVIPLIICEDLSCYGFDVTYDHSLRELTIEKSVEKAPQPISMGYYRQFKAGTKLYRINNLSNIKVSVIKDGEKIALSDVKDFNGYVGISADEIANIYGGIWDGASKSIKIGQ